MTADDGVILPGMEWCGRVTEVEGDVFTALLTPADHDGPELIADFSAAQCGITCEPGDILTVTPGRVTRVELPQWTQEEIGEIMRRARARHRQMMECAD
jgi:hypothetical protein